MRTALLTLLLMAVALTGSADRRRLLMTQNPAAGTNQWGMIGGLIQSDWANQNVLVGSYTVVSDYAGQGMYYSGTARQAKIWIATAAQIVKVKQFRPIGTNVFNWIADVGIWNLSVGTNTIYFTNQMQEGDCLGLWLSNATGTVTMRNGNGSRFSTGDQSGSAYSFSSSTAHRLNMEITGEAPKVAFTGDSIITGYPNSFPSGMNMAAVTGNATNSMTWKLGNELGWSTPYVNFAYPNKTLEFVNTNLMTLATNTLATTLWLHCGVNDIANGFTWTSFLTNLNSIRAKWASTNTLIVSEILPASTLTDGQSFTIRDWNTNLSVWCATSSATLFPIHTHFATNRPSTSMPDDIAVRFTSDGIHLSTMGHTNYGVRAKAYLP